VGSGRRLGASGDRERPEVHLPRLRRRRTEDGVTMMEDKTIAMHANKIVIDGELADVLGIVGIQRIAVMILREVSASSTRGHSIEVSVMGATEFHHDTRVVTGVSK
jgi:hypothetical protein